MTSSQAPSKHHETRPKTLENTLYRRGTRVHAKLQWLQERDEDSEFFFDFLKKKVAADKVLSLRRDNDSL
jgi:hypothetical protein